MSDQKSSEATSPDSSDAAVLPQSIVSSASENNVSCSSNSSDNTNPNSTSNHTASPSVLTSQNCSVLRKSFLNQVSNSASTSENVVSTTPKFQLKSSSFGNNLLKPSTLSASKSGGCGFALKAATLKNPFAKNVSLPEVSNSSQEGAGSGTSEEVTSSEQVSQLPGGTAPAPPLSEAHLAPSSSTSLSSGMVSPPKFVPLLANSTTAASNSTSAGGFVFGQNLRDRVEAVEEEQASAGEASSSATGNAFASTNGTTDMLFTTVLQKETTEKVDSGGEDNGLAPAKSLSEAAREYEEARAIKRKYDEVAVVTGEEEEANVLQINCKLFLYDTVKTWIELGRGQLRLNDISNSLSRIVIRVAGSLRVILNTKIWAGMVVQKASDNSVRLTAKENGQAKVYLVKASSKEIDQLYKALEWRVNQRKRLGLENGNGAASQEEDEAGDAKRHIGEAQGHIGEAQGHLSEVQGHISEAQGHISEAQVVENGADSAALSQHST